MWVRFPPPAPSFPDRPALRRRKLPIAGARLAVHRMEDDFQCSACRGNRQHGRASDDDCPCQKLHCHPQSQVKHGRTFVRPVDRLSYRIETDRPIRLTRAQLRAFRRVSVDSCQYATSKMRPSVDELRRQMLSPRRRAQRSRPRHFAGVHVPTCQPALGDT